MDIQITQVLFQIINFGIILFVLQKFLLKPITQILEKRSKQVEQGQVAAEKNLKDRQHAEEQAESEINKARQEARTIVAEAKKTAEADAQEILQKAKAEAKEAIKKERQAFETMMAEERQQLKQDLVSLVTEATEQLLKDSLSSADLKAIVAKQSQSLKKLKIT